ncbi:MAG: helical backbone metal receptor [Cryomorphaceae bacterium]
MEILDQTGRELHFDQVPQRIVSLVPSITELAVDLGFDVVGKTKFCVHPKNLDSAIKVGGTKNVKVDLVKKLKPDLILANKEENTKSTVKSLINDGFPVFVSDVSTIDQSLDLINRLGTIGGFESGAEDLIGKISEGIKSIPQINPRPKALYLIWQNPYMAAGVETYISDVMAHLSIDNVLAAWGERGFRYPIIAKEQIEEIKPDLIFLSSEPYPFKETQCKSMISATGIPTLLVDGECFSWYGSRQAKSIDYLKKFSRLLRN